METEKPAVNKAVNSPKQDTEIEDINHEDRMFVDNESDVDTQQNVSGDQVFIKRAWSLKDLFKRNSEAKIHLPEPNTVTQ